MATEVIQLSYSAQLCRVRCEISRAQALSSERPPYDLVNRARAKLEAMKKVGEIEFFMVFETRLQEVWSSLQQAAHLPETARCVLTLGAGAPVCPTLEIEALVSDNVLGNLSAGPLSGSALQWPYEWFKLNVGRVLRNLGIRELPHDAQLSAYWLKLQHGEALKGVPLQTVAFVAATGQPSTRPYSILANKQRLEISILIRSLEGLVTKEQRESLFKIVQQGVTKLSQPGNQFTLLRREVLQALHLALEGPEGLGLEVPCTLLVAFGSRDASNGDVPSKNVAGPLIEANYPGAGRISFNVSADKMEATIALFQLPFYDDPTFKVDLEWIAKELKLCGIRGPIPEDAGKVLSQAIGRRANLEGLLVCRGKVGSGGTGPFLFHTYKEANGRIPNADLEKDSLNIRDMQNRTTVTVGQLISEIRYKVDPKPGENIYGEEIPPPPGEKSTAVAGPGVELKDGCKFYATQDGCPIFEGTQVAITKTLIHKGDVNLRTGNIYFRGSVEIFGSIDQGAVVECGGDLVVHGEIRGAAVWCRGMITVKGGVTTGTTGSIHCKSHFNADFVDRSLLVVGGNIILNKVLLNSKVACSGTIQILAADGMIGGGHIISRDSVRTANLGFRMGASTVMDIGVDWRIALGLEIRELRVEKINKKLQEDRQTLREIIQKNKAQMTPRHVQMKEELQDRLTRMRGIIDRLEALKQLFRSRLTFSSTAQIYVVATLAANVQVELCGQKIPILGEVASACLSSKKRRGSYIIPLEEIEKEEQENGTSPFETEKKAS